jgi:Tfp pilus assembly protein PilF
MRLSLALAGGIALSGFGCFHSNGSRTSLFSMSEPKDSTASIAIPQPKSQELPNKQTAMLNITMAGELEKKGQESEAIAYYELARQLDPSLNEKASRRLAVLYDRADDQAKAMHEFQELLKKRPRDAALLNDLGYSYYNRAQWAEAESQLRKAVAIDKSNKPAWVNLGLALAQQSKHQEALEAFGHAVSTAEAYANLGFVLAVQGKKDEALATYRHALELEPALKIAQAAVQRLENGEAERSVLQAPTTKPQ